MYNIYIIQKGLSMFLFKLTTLHLAINLHPFIYRLAVKHVLGT